MRSFTQGLVQFICLLVIGFELEATSMVKLSTQELAAQAGWIGRIHILSSQVQRRGVPYEVFEVEIKEVFKGRGDVGQKFFFSRPGGRQGQRTVAVVGAPILRAGREYVVFLDEDPQFQFRDTRTEVQLKAWTAYEILPAKGNRKAQVVRPGSILTPRASRAYGASALAFGGVAMGDYDSLVVDIFRGLD